MRGRSIALSRPRKLVVDLLHFARKVPSLPVQRAMQVPDVIAARSACKARPQWTAIFTKAYALLAREMPVLRRAYVKLPWPHIYEYPVSSVTIIFEREYEGELGVFSYRVKDPASLPLEELRRDIADKAAAPIESVKDFRFALQIARLPRPLRRLLWGIALNIGRQRGNYFGTYGISSYSSLNVDSLHPLTPLTVTLNYGPIASDGRVNVRMIYDHRVMDGATVARALNRLEAILNGPIVDELRALA